MSDQPQLPPVIDLLIRYDSRNDSIELVTLPRAVPGFDVLFDMLDAARRELRKAELQQLRSLRAQQLKPDGAQDQVHGYQGRAEQRENETGGGQ